jgi:propanol-preferring alcohol dehydrogenase
MATMKAMVLRAFGAPLVAEEVPVPEIGEDDALVKVKACGVCHTDLKIIAGKIAQTKPPPLIPGHEVAGEVVRVGDRVAQVKPGDRVSVNFYLTCGQCRYCRTGSETLCLNLKGQLGRSVHGGYAEYIAVPAENCLRLPEEIPFAHGAVLADAVATSLHAVRVQAGVRLGDAVGVIGIGGVGIHVLQMARLSGARVLAMDIKERSLALAREYGAEEALNIGGGDPPAEALRFTAGLGLDAIVDTVGSDRTIALALSLLAHRGRLVLLGYDPVKPFSANALQLVLKEQAILGSRAATKLELAEAIQLVHARRITPVVTESHPLGEANQVLESLRAGRIVCRAVLLP